MSATTPSPPLPPPQRQPKSRPKPPPPDWLCAECSTNATPVRRGGPLGRATLCNACGLRLAKRNRSSAASIAAAADAAAADAADQRTDPASQGTADEDSRGVSVSSADANSNAAQPRQGKKRSASASRMAGRGVGRKRRGKGRARSDSNAERGVASRSSKKDCQVEIRPNISEHVESANCPIVAEEETLQGSTEQDQAVGATQGNKPQATGEAETGSTEEEAIHAQHNQQRGVLEWQSWHGENSRVHRARENAQNDTSAIHMQQHCVQFSIRHHDTQGEQSEMAALNHGGISAVPQRSDETQTGQTARLAEPTRMIAERLEEKQAWEMADRERAERARLERERDLARIAAQQQLQQHDQRQLRQKNISTAHAQPSQPVTSDGDAIGVEEFFEGRSGGQGGTSHDMFRHIGNPEEIIASEEAGRAEEISTGNVLAEGHIQLDDAILPVLPAAQLPYETVRSTGRERNVDRSGSLDAPVVGMQARSSAEGIEWMPNAHHREIAQTQMPPSVFQQIGLSQPQQGHYHQHASHHEEINLAATANQFVQVSREEEVSTAAHVQPRGGPSRRQIRRIKIDDVRDANHEEIRENTPYLTQELLERLDNAVRDLSRLVEETKALDARAKVVTHEISRRKLEVASLKNFAEILMEPFTILKSG